MTAPAAADTWAAHLERHAALCRRWGKPVKVPAGAGTAAALRALGVSGIDPDDAIAFLYSSAEAFAAFAASNLEHGGWRSFGPVVTDAGVLGAVCVPARFVRRRLDDAEHERGPARDHLD